ncbi:MAG: glycosyltransferase family 4 protein [Synechococcales bacterium]|nr:glycosyltransferase family 4 protein [Synechococcales bacterium]
MNITLVTSSLKGGGAERVVTLLAQGFCDRGHSVHVISLSRPETDFYPLPPGVTRQDLGVLRNSPTPFHAIWNNLERLWQLRRSILASQPDAVISFMVQTNILCTIALLGTGCPVLATEHCDIHFSQSGTFWEKLRYLIYPHSAKVVSVSQGVDDGFDWLPQHKRAVVYNPLVIPTHLPPVAELPTQVDPQKKWLISMGRLKDQKGMDILLQAFARLAPQYPDWQLLILGEGPLREELEALRDRLGLQQQAIFTGAVGNPFPLLEQAELFAIASRFEGFPMAHGEAMACGLPVVATDCPSGPREIVRPWVDGLLVPPEDEIALSAALERLMMDQELRQKFSARAPEVIERFGMTTIMETWEHLVMSLKQSAEWRMEIL